MGNTLFIKNMRDVCCLINQKKRTYEHNAEPFKKYIIGNLEQGNNELLTY